MAVCIVLPGPARAQAKLPLPEPGAEHPALIVQLMTRLCAVVHEAAAAGQEPPASRLAELTHAPAFSLVEGVRMIAASSPRLGWSAYGQLAIGTRVTLTQLQAELSSCVLRSGHFHGAMPPSKTLSCELSPAPNTRCELALNERWTGALGDIDGPPPVQIRDLRLTVIPSPSKRQKSPPPTPRTPRNP